MKVVFPCNGSLVLQKHDLETLKAFYNTNLLTSKMNEPYKNSNIMVQVGNFNYLPQKDSIVLYKANVLTIEKMRKILGLYRENNNTTNTAQPSENALNNDTSSKISDNDLLSHPFFQTLKPLN